MTDIIVNASTSLVNINSSNISPGFNQIVLLSSVNSPGAIITIRDYAGFCSTNRKIIISTTSDTQFLDGAAISSFEIVTPFGFFTVSPRSPSIWTVLNSFAFGTQPNASVSSLIVTGQIVSDRILNASTFSTAHVQTSSITVKSVLNASSITVTSGLNASSILSVFINASTISTTYLNASTIDSRRANISTLSSIMNNTSSLIVTGLASTATTNTSSLFINGTNAYLVTSVSLSTNKLAVSSIVPFTAGGTSVTVEGALRATGGLIGKSGGPLFSDWGLNIISTNTTSQGLIWGYSNSTNNAADFHYFYTANGSTSNRVAMGFYDNGDIMNILASGNVGIGTTTPSYKLDVNGNTRIYKAGDLNSNSYGTSDSLVLQTSLTVYNNSKASLLFVTATGNNPLARIVALDTQTSFGGPFKGDLIFQTGNETYLREAMRITNSLRVGIGTTTPETNLHVKGTILVTLCNTATTSASPNLTLRNAADSELHKIMFLTALSAGNYSVLTGNNDKAIIFSDGSLNTGNLVIGPHSDSANGIKIMSNGNVGVGTASPGNRLDVNGNVRVFNATNDVMGLFSPTYGNYIHIGAWNQAGNTSKNLVLNEFGGNVGIGTNSPAKKLTVAGGDIGLDNQRELVAKNSAGNYEGFLVGRWSDNATYFTYGSGGLVIRNSVATNAMFIGNDRVVTADRYFKHPDSVVAMKVVSNGSFTRSGGQNDVRVCNISYTTKQTGNVVIVVTAATQPYLSGGSGNEVIEVRLIRDTNTILSFNLFRYFGTNAEYYRASTEPNAQGLIATTTVNGSASFEIQYALQADDNWGSRQSQLVLYELAN